MTTNPLPPEQEARRQLWNEHAESFGLDGSDPEVLEAVAGAKNFKDLNNTLTSMAKAPDVLDRMWQSPEVQRRHLAEVAKVQQEEAAPDRVIARYAAAWKNGGKPSAELT